MGQHSQVLLILNLQVCHDQNTFWTEASTGFPYSIVSIGSSIRIVEAVRSFACWWIAGPNLCFCCCNMIRLVTKRA